MDYLVDSEWLNTHLDDKNIVIVDCSSRSLYEHAHIPGSVFLPKDYWLKENNEENIARGAKLIGGKEFEVMVSKMGINNDTTVITYDSSAGKPSIRVWWVFKYFGHKNVKVLSGGWKSWIDTGFRVTNVETRRSISSYKVFPNNDYIIDKESLLKNLKNCQLVDARSLKEWSGQDPHGNPRNGKIPHAINIEWSAFLESPDSLKIDFNKAKRILKNHKLMPEQLTVTYCQSGVRAAFVAFVLESLGFKNIKVYDGSMYEWSRDKNLPVEKEN